MIDYAASAFNAADNLISRARTAVKAARRSGDLNTPAVLSPGNQGINLGGSKAVRQAQKLKGMVYAALRPVAQRIASLPLHVAEVTDPDAQPATPVASKAVHYKAHACQVMASAGLLPERLKALAPNLQLTDTHPFLKRLMKPNDLHTRSELLVCTVLSLEVTGRGYWFFDDDGSIWYMPPAWVSADHRQKLYGGWVVQPALSGKSYDVPFEQIVEFRWPDPFDPLGYLSPTGANADAIAADEAMQQANQRTFKNGIFAGTIISIGQETPLPGMPATRPTLTQQQRDEIVYAVRRMAGGTLHHGEPLILDQVIQGVHPFQTNVREMDYLSSSKFTGGRIFAGYGVNKYVVGDTENSNRATAVVSESNFCDNVINPKVEYLNEVLQYYVFPRYEANPDAYRAFLELAQPRDTEMQLKRLTLLADRGALERDELRAALGYPPMRDGAGQTIALMPGQVLLPAATQEHGTEDLDPPQDRSQGSDNGRDD